MNENETYIKDIRIYQAVSKLSHPIADSTHDISKIAFYVLEVETKGGVIGQGYLLSFHYSPNAIEGALKDMKNFVLAKDYHVYETAQVQKDYEIESEYFGIVGLQRGTGNFKRSNVGCMGKNHGTADLPDVRMPQKTDPGIRKRRMDQLHGRGTF